MGCLWSYMAIMQSLPIDTENQNEREGPMLAEGTRKGTISRLIVFLVLCVPIVSVAFVWLVNGSPLSLLMLPITVYLVCVTASDVWLLFVAERDDSRGYKARRYFVPLLLVASVLSAYQVWWFFASAH